MTIRISRPLLFLLLCALAGCASVGALEGGKKDTKPPVLVYISPADSQLNTRVTKIELRFDEYVALNDPAKEIQISPILAIPPMVTSISKKVTLRIPDSLLTENTTYRISFGSSVKDIHEDNKISGLTYTFSTGSYFDSLEVSGKVINARSGMPDSAAIILLYPATVDDSAVIRSKPLYIGRTKGDGSFSVKGLPGKKFRIYALDDANNNLIFDGGKEKVGFIEQLVMPGDSLAQTIQLRTFEEVQDTLVDTSVVSQGKARLSGADRRNADKPAEFSYSVLADTSDTRNRTKEIIKPLEIIFSHPLKDLQRSKMALVTDSTAQQAFTVEVDSLRKNVLIVSSAWMEDTVYTLKLQKGFVKDTAGNDAMPSRWSFRTKRDDDYSKLTLNVPSKYKGNKYVLLVKTDKDTVYNKPLADTTVTITRLMPGAYTARIIIDVNENGLWDTGDLLLKRQPEYVVPFPSAITLKPGWDNIVDLEPKKPAVKGGGLPPKQGTKK